MSGVYVKGMEMPKIDLEWRIIRGQDGKWYAIDVNAETSDGEWHEIVPVPPHGRLKDYDRIMERYSKWFRNTENREYENMFYMLQNELRGAPTIIPASKEGE